MWRRRNSEASLARKPIVMLINPDGSLCGAVCVRGVSVDRFDTLVLDHEDLLCQQLSH